MEDGDVEVVPRVATETASPDVAGHAPEDGAGSTVFGSRGAGNFLTKLTTGAAVVFMLTSLTLAYFAQEGSQSTLFDEEQEETAAAEETSPFAEVPAPAGEGPGEENP